MAQHSEIEWTGGTWPVVQGCDYDSPGCTNCYAVRTIWRLAHNPNPKISAPLQGLVRKTDNGKLLWTGEIALRHDRLLDPLRWREPQKIFLPSHGDLFHEDVPDEFIDAVFATMALAPRHTFQVLTKRSARMQKYLANEYGALPGRVFPHWAKAAVEIFGTGFREPQPLVFPLPNVWLGVSVEDQKHANQRIPDLLATPAAVRFLSCEPLLGPVDLRNIRPDLTMKVNCLTGHAEHLLGMKGEAPHIDQVICGGESGPGKRPTDVDWHRSLRDQCKGAGVAFFEKQIDKKQEIPADLMVREFPAAALKPPSTEDEAMSMGEGREG